MSQILTRIPQLPIQHIFEVTLDVFQSGQMPLVSYWQAIML